MLRRRGQDHVLLPSQIPAVTESDWVHEKVLTFPSRGETGTCDQGRMNGSDFTVASPSGC